jgi:hypothetical protein
MRTRPEAEPFEGYEEWKNRPRPKVKHACSAVAKGGDELCRRGASFERDGKWYCHHHDPDRHLSQCSATNAAGNQCGNLATVERDGTRFCSTHDPSPDPDEPRRQWEAAIEERDRKAWAAATVTAAADGVKVFLIREDVLKVVRAWLGRLPYQDVEAVMRAIAVLPEAPFTGRERVVIKD